MVESLERAKLLSKLFKMLTTGIAEAKLESLLYNNSMDRADKEMKECFKKNNGKDLLKAKKLLIKRKSILDKKITSKKELLKQIQKVKYESVDTRDITDIMEDFVITQIEAYEVICSGVKRQIIKVKMMEELLKI